MRRLPSACAAAGLAVLLASCGQDESGRGSGLLLVEVASGERKQLADERSYSSPSWSPDSQRLAVVASGPEAGAIEVIDADSSGKQAVARRRGFIQGLAWSPRGDTLAYVRLLEPATWTLETVAADGSGARELASHHSDRVAEVGPSWAPDGARIAFTAGADTFVVFTRAGRARLLLADAWAPRWAPNGQSVLLATGDSLVAAPPDRGRPTTIADGLIDAHAAWSPDSDRVAFSGVTRIGDRHYHLYLATAGSERPIRIADEPVADAPAWSPDGRSLAYASWNGKVRLVTLAAGEIQTLTRIPDVGIRDLAWSPDGASLAFVARDIPED